jgi:hypothetical protein
MHAGMKLKITFQKWEKGYGNHIKIDGSCGEYGHSMEIGNRFFSHLSFRLKN